MDSKSELPSTPIGSRGLGGTWVMGMMLVVCLAMILGLLWMIAMGGLSAFWPKPIERLSLKSGELVIGVHQREEVAPDGSARTLYRVGNKDLGNPPFLWVDDAEIVDRQKPGEVVLVERLEWGIWIGVPERIVRIDEQGHRDVLAEGTAETLAILPEQLREAQDRRRRIDAIRSRDIETVNRELDALRRKELEIQLRTQNPPRPSHLGWGGWVGVVLGSGAALLASRRLRRTQWMGPMVLLAMLLMLVAILERPWHAWPVSPEAVMQRMGEIQSQRQALGERFTALSMQTSAIEAEDAEFRIVIRDERTGRFAPMSRSAPDEPMRLSQIVRVVQPNTLSIRGRLGVYLARWWAYLSTNPREANTEGGVFPVIIGTLVVTLLLTVAVVPLGVIAALYIREYASQGAVISILRVAINNLAGVPSIVYGIFGLGVFCYGLGGVIDGGTSPALRLPYARWWILVTVVASLFGAALAFGANRSNSRRGVLLFWSWFLAVLLTIVAVLTTPYFDGFFRAKLLDGSPTFGTPGLLWSAFTLALLTLPVVIVATEEAIAAVPASLREGSYGCGASKWQTIRRVVLPGAMPGIMTGAILAMARGAGEVAPLMIVGAVKLAPKLPFEWHPPFLFANRSFMHLGFHIYDLAFQSPDSEAARGMVWATTLLLVSLVVLMNLFAIRIRSRIRSRLHAGQF